MKTRTYTPDEFVNFGAAGEHPVTFTYYVGPGQGVVILSAIAKITDGERVQSLDITNRIFSQPYTLEDWETEIMKDYQEHLGKEWEEGA